MELNGADDLYKAIIKHADDENPKCDISKLQEIQDKIAERDEKLFFKETEVYFKSLQDKLYQWIGQCDEALKDLEKENKAKEEKLKKRPRIEGIGDKGCKCRPCKKHVGTVGFFKAFTPVEEIDTSHARFVIISKTIEHPRLSFIRYKGIPHQDHVINVFDRASPIHGTLIICPHESLTFEEYKKSEKASEENHYEKEFKFGKLFIDVLPRTSVPGGYLEINFSIKNMKDDKDDKFYIIWQQCWFDRL